MQPHNLTATIWLSPYRLTFCTSDMELTGAINRPSADLLDKSLCKLFEFLITQGYRPIILHTEH